MLPVWILYGVFFRYGLSPIRALTTFLLCILIGYGGVHHANVNHLLVKNTSTSAVALRDSQKGPEPFIPYSRESGLSDLECGASINELVYAVDVFIPLLNLHQEERCDVRSVSDHDRSPRELSRQTSGGRWSHVRSFCLGLIDWPPSLEFLKFFYAISGRIISSLMLLTVSGALRKWESR